MRVCLPEKKCVCVCVFTLRRGFIKITNASQCEQKIWSQFLRYFCPFNLDIKSVARLHSNDARGPLLQRTKEFISLIKKTTFIVNLCMKCVVLALVLQMQSRVHCAAKVQWHVTFKANVFSLTLVLCVLFGDGMTGIVPQKPKECSTVLFRMAAFFL